MDNTDEAAQPLLYTINETCQRLGGVSRSFLYQEINAGKLETTKLGDRRFTTEAQLRRYIASKQPRRRLARATEAGR